MWSNFHPPRKDFFNCTTQVLRVDLGQEHSLGRGERPQAPVLGLPFAVLLKKIFDISISFPTWLTLWIRLEVKLSPEKRSNMVQLVLRLGRTYHLRKNGSQLNFSFKILTKVQFIKFDQTPASKSLPNFINCFDSVDWFYQLLPPLPLVLSQYLKAP